MPNEYTEEWLTEHEFKARTKGLHINNQASPLPAADAGPESDLSKKIRAYCKGKGWPCLIFPQSKLLSRFIPDGWPDCVVIAPRRVVFIELKAEKGRKSKAQMLMTQMFGYLGHKIHEVRSYKRALEVLHGP